MYTKQKGAIIIQKFHKNSLYHHGFYRPWLRPFRHILPVLPTTPLLLLASFCFVKGSERFEIWFKGTTIYKRHLETFVKERSMTLKQKITLLLFADVMIAIAFFLVNILLVRITLVAVVLYKYYYFIYKIKTVQQ